MMKYLIIETVPEQFLNNALAVSQNNSNRLLAMFGTDETAWGEGLNIYCVFQIADNDKQQLKIIKAKFAVHECKYSSLTPYIPAANWYEREIKDMFGLEAVGHPDLRPLVLHENYPLGIHPLRKSFAVTQKMPIEQKEYLYPRVEGEGVFEVPVGPIHAGIIEPGHFVFSQAGETVLNLEAKLFFTHRGIEKAVEGKNISQALFMAERICGACAVSHALSFCQAVEGLSTVRVSRYAKAIRCVVAELERLYNHVGDFGNISAGLAFAPVISHGARLKEQLLRINERLTGNRWLRGVVVPGGVKKEISQEQLAPVVAELQELEKQIRSIADSMYDQHEFVNRVSNTGIVPLATAAKMCFSGIAGRATGLEVDTRREFPYALYDELDFTVRTETTGDVDARLRVRISEIYDSIKLLVQLLKKLKKYEYEPLCVDLGRLQTETLSIGMSESARGNNLYALLLDGEQRVYRMFVRSASHSNWPALPVAVPGNIIPDFPLVNKSFELCYACLDR